MRPVALCAILLVAACSSEMPTKTEWKAPATAPAPAPVVAHVDIAVTEAGFEPARVAVPRGQPVTLVFTRKTDKTCAKAVVLNVDEKTRIEKDLPLGQPVTIAATFPTAGELHYTCGMNMVTGVLAVR
jgi:plastocyanin domain-containing protein